MEEGWGEEEEEGLATPSVTIHSQASSASLLPAWASKPQVPCLVALTPSGWHNSLLPPSGGLLLRLAFRITNQSSFPAYAAPPPPPYPRLSIATSELAGPGPL